MGLIEALLSLSPRRLESDYRSRELPRDYVEPPLAVRLDGVNFGKALADLPGPRNAGVHRALFASALELAKSSGASWVYVVSDEVNLIYKSLLPYRGRLLKLISVLPSALSAKVTALLGRPLYFDARIVKIYDERDAARYVAYRARIGLNNYVISLAKAKGLVESITPRVNYILNDLGDIDLSLGWGTLATEEDGWNEVNLCQFLSRYKLC